MTFERKMLQKLLHTNVELEKLFKDSNIGTFIKFQSDGWDIYNGWMMQETPRKYIPGQLTPKVT